VARKHAEPAVLPPRPWKRALVVAAVIVLVVAALLWIFRERIETAMTIGELHSDDPAVRKAARDELAASDGADMDDVLYEEFLDTDRPFTVRTQLGQVLLRRGRLPKIERALRSDDVQARIAALAVIYAHRLQIPDDGNAWFRREYGANPAYPVKETLLAWLRSDDDYSRLQAIQIAQDLPLPEAVPILRELAVPTARGNLGRSQRGLVSAAATALLALKDCEVVPALLELAKNSDDERIRLRMTQVVYQAVAGPQPACPDAVPEADVKSMVVAGLDGAPEVRQGALLILAQRPPWAAEIADRLLAILDGKHGDNVYVRRAALGALAAVGDDAFGRRLPRYFHAEDPNIRSQAVSASFAYAEKPGFEHFFPSCWIGVLRDETGSDVAFEGALGGLRQAAGRYVGIPDSVTGEAKGRRERQNAFRDEMYKRGESHGVSRDAWATRWFEWWASELGLSGSEVDAAVAARAAFWKAARQGDDEAARRALDAVPRREPGLFTYEAGWLDAR